MGTKSLYDVRRTSLYGAFTEEQLDTLTEGQLDALEWAKDFMNAYERKHKKK